MSAPPIKDPYVNPVALEAQQPPPTRKRDGCYNLYSTPWKDLAAWQIALRLLISLLIGAAVGAIIGVIIRYA